MKTKLRLSLMKTASLTRQTWHLKSKQHSIKVNTASNNAGPFFRFFLFRNFFDDVFLISKILNEWVVIARRPNFFDSFFKHCQYYNFKILVLSQCALSIGLIWGRLVGVWNWEDKVSGRLRFGFGKKLLLYECNFDELPTFFILSSLLCGFAVALLLQPPKSDDKNGQEMFNWSEAHSKKEYYL